MVRKDENIHKITMLSNEVVEPSAVKFRIVRRPGRRDFK